MCALTNPNTLTESEKRTDGQTDGIAVSNSAVYTDARYAYKKLIRRSDTRT